jgi:hypothetical protein
VKVEDSLDKIARYRMPMHRALMQAHDAQYPLLQTLDQRQQLAIDTMLERLAFQIGVTASPRNCTLSAIESEPESGRIVD